MCVRVALRLSSHTYIYDMSAPMPVQRLSSLRISIFQLTQRKYAGTQTWNCQTDDKIELSTFRITA